MFVIIFSDSIAILTPFGRNLAVVAMEFISLPKVLAHIRRIHITFPVLDPCFNFQIIQFLSIEERRVSGYFRWKAWCSLLISFFLYRS